FQSAVDRNLQFCLDFLLQLIDPFIVEYAFAEKIHLRARYRIALRVTLALRFRSVEAFVIGQRMRVWPNDVRVDKGWPESLAAVSIRTLERGKAPDRLGAVDLVDEDIRKPG